ncbi:MAG: prephenate dehydratase [Candidatus Korarchaeum sp.]|nr:prephenate dehydratase [Candidatus Korarchaeum sp.]MDW8035860.1 prephenate dehydratase [Candidatus Korarchaeum sp.]
MKVAIQGERGSYSEEAALKYFRMCTYELITKNYLEEVFDSVQSGEADYGVIPIENSSTGSIRKSLDLLLAKDVKVVGESKVRVSHALLGVKGAKLSDIERVYSHPEAISQCEDFLRRCKWTMIPSLDTAGAARFIAENKDKRSAAVASERAASIYGLEVITRNIQDVPVNITRFFVISLSEQLSHDADATAAFFATRHTPGSLWRALGTFAKRGINLLWLESRPIKGEPWNYSFYVEFEGSLLDNFIREAIQELKELTVWVKLLGSYKRMPLE